MGLDGTYTITNTSFVADIKPNADGASSTLLIATNDGGSKFKWVFESQGADASNFYYTIKNKGDSMYISTDTSATVTSAVNIQSTSFIWAVNPVAGLTDIYNIITPDSGLYLQAAASALNSKIILSSTGTGKLAQWKIVKA